MNIPLLRTLTAHRIRSRDLRHLVLDCFSHSPSTLVDRFADLDESTWWSNVRWLDTSGLALYLLDHLKSLGQQSLLPPSLCARIEQNLIDNSLRNANLLAEAADVNREFQRREIQFANLKGITLTPDSVPNPALRYQLDLDFLVLAEDASSAAQALKYQGYQLTCRSGNSWEFKTCSEQSAKLKNLYKDKPQRSAELHLTSADGPLERVQLRSFDGVTFPALSPVDLFIMQALHLFKHLRESFTRAAWLLEYRRHMLTRRDDTKFWEQLRLQLLHAPEISRALGVATLLAVDVFGDEAPALLLEQVQTSVPVSVQLWIRLYGRSALLADFPGTKLNLLLERELVQTGYRPRGRVLPRRGPRSKFAGRVDENLVARCRRRGERIAFLVTRLRFHVVEGARYFIEASRFRRRLLEQVQ